MPYIVYVQCFINHETFFMDRLMLVFLDTFTLLFSRFEVSKIFVEVVVTHYGEWRSSEKEAYRTRVLYCERLLVDNDHLNETMMYSEINNLGTIRFS